MVPDVYVDGGVTVEILGGNARVTCHALCKTTDGYEREPRIALIVPADSLHRIAQQLAAAHLLKPDMPDGTDGHG